VQNRVNAPEEGVPPAHSEAKEKAQAAGDEMSSEREPACLPLVSARVSTRHIQKAIPVDFQRSSQASSSSYPLAVALKETGSRDYSETIAHAYVVSESWPQQQTTALPTEALVISTNYDTASSRSASATYWRQHSQAASDSRAVGASSSEISVRHSALPQTVATEQATTLVAAQPAQQSSRPSPRSSSYLAAKAAEQAAAEREQQRALLARQEAISLREEARRWLDREMEKISARNLALNEQLRQMRKDNADWDAIVNYRDFLWLKDRSDNWAAERSNRALARVPPQGLTSEWTIDFLARVQRDNSHVAITWPPPPEQAPTELELVERALNFSRMLERQCEQQQRLPHSAPEQRRSKHQALPLTDGLKTEASAQTFLTILDLVRREPRELAPEAPSPWLLPQLPQQPQDARLIPEQSTAETVATVWHQLRRRRFGL